MICCANPYPRLPLTHTLKGSHTPVIPYVWVVAVEAVMVTQRLS
jgi:hypothetical protein